MGNVAVNKEVRLEGVLLRGLVALLDLNPRFYCRRSLTTIRSANLASRLPPVQSAGGDPGATYFSPNCPKFISFKPAARSFSRSAAMLSESNVESVANWKNAHSKSGRVAYACWRPEAPKSDGVTIKRD